MNEVFLGLGSNIRRYHYISQALNALQARFSPLRISPVYEAQAVGFEGAAFLNLVVSFSCDMPVAELAVLLRQLEIEHGRAADAAKFSSRTLDIDILCYGKNCGEQLDAANVRPELNLTSLVLPRAEILHNAYVFRPLGELAGRTGERRVGEE